MPIASLTGLPQSFTGALVLVLPVPSMVLMPEALPITTLGSSPLSPCLSPLYPECASFDTRTFWAVASCLGLAFELPICGVAACSGTAAACCCPLPTSGRLLTSGRSAALAATLPATSRPPMIAPTLAARLVQIFTLLLLLRVLRSDVGRHCVSGTFSAPAIPATPAARTTSYGSWSTLGAPCRIGSRRPARDQRRSGRGRRPRRRAGWRRARPCGCRGRTRWSARPCPRPGAVSPSAALSPVGVSAPPRAVSRPGYPRCPPAWRSPLAPPLRRVRAVPQRGHAPVRAAPGLRPPATGAADASARGASAAPDPGASAPRGGPLVLFDGEPRPLGVTRGWYWIVRPSLLRAPRALDRYGPVENYSTSIPTP